MASTITDEMIIDVEANIYEFLNSATIEQLVAIIEYARDKYFNDEGVISDNTYDMLIEQLTLLDPDNPILDEVAAEITSGIRIQLPYHMGSMSKVKPSDDKVFDRWKGRFTGPYIISNKLDGVSAMLVVNRDGTANMYKKGRKGVGADISHLIQYVNIVNFKNIHKYVNQKKMDKLVLRGELIIKKNTFFEKYSTFSNPRNFVSGQTNSKTLNISHLNDIDLVFYEVIDPWNTIDNQYNLMMSLHLSVSHFSLAEKKDLTLSYLSNLLSERLSSSEYEIDGLIISDIKQHDRNTSGNPEYSIAFKETLIVVTAEVTSVEWNESKHGYLKPTILIRPISIGGVEIKRATGFNGKFILSNNIGPGTILQIMRSGDVIPHITKITSPTYAQMPDPDEYGEWSFNKSGIDIIVHNKMTKGRLIKILTSFAKQLEIKGVDEATFSAFVHNGLINKFSDIFNITVEKITDMNLEGFQTKKINNTVNAIHDGIERMTLLDLMVGSNLFGMGFGERKLKKILQVYPDIILKSYLPHKVIADMIDDIEGFDEITAEQFASRLGVFNELLETVPTKYKHKLLQETIPRRKAAVRLENNLFASVVITGFRDKTIEQFVASQGGEVKDSVSKNTTLVIYADVMDENTNKLTKAKQLNIPLIKRSDFMNKYMRVGL
jgi:NAD-dependent DNA ligase